MNVRLANLEDAFGLQHLYKQLQPEDPNIPISDFTRALESILHSNHLKLYVLEVNRLLVATCYLCVIENLSRGLAPYAVLENVLTDADHRANGYGKTVVKHALSDAWALGCYKVMLSTGSKQESTLKFYERCGFVRGQKTGFLAKPNT